VNSAIFNHPTAIAATQACAIVGGHVFGIISAHEKRLRYCRRTVRCAPSCRCCW
jgi:hypothetical protein